MRKDVVFVSAVCKAESKNLLTKEQISRLCDADLDEALKILHEKGYNDGVYTADSFDVDKFMSRQVALLVDFVKEYAPTQRAEKFILAPLECNNIRALYKESRGGAKSLLYNVDVSLDDLPKEIATVMNGLGDDISPKDADYELAKAEADYTLRLAKGNKLFTEFAKAKIDGINLLAKLRAKRLGIEMPFILGGNFADKDAVKFEGTPYEEFASDDSVALETGFSVALSEIAGSRNVDVDSCGPLLWYFNAKYDELKTVKMILVCIKSNARSEIAKRIRGLHE